MNAMNDVGESLHRSRHTVSAERLECLVRHWAWTDEARTRFERELAQGWVYDEDPAADHPFGAFYHWCALLASFIDALAVDGLLPSWQRARIRADLNASRSDLQAGANLLLAIPSAIEAHPLIVDLLADDERLGRLRWLHQASGDAIRRECSWQSGAATPISRSGCTAAMSPVAGQPNVDENASIPASRNAISTVRSTMDPGCRISW